MQGWRTGDVPWFVLLLAIVAFGVAVVGVASTGAGGVAVAALLVAAAVALAIRWSSAPFSDEAPPGEQR